MSPQESVPRKAIVRTVREAIRNWSAAHRAQTPSWMRHCTMDSVDFMLEIPDATDTDQFNRWVAGRRNTGWTRGAKMDARKKTHPLMVEAEELSEMDKRMIALVRVVVATLA